MERHHNRIYGNTTGSDYDSELDASFDENADPDSVSSSDVSYRSSESDEPNEPVEDAGWHFVHPVGPCQPVDERHTQRIPFTGREAGIRPGSDGELPAFSSPTACFKSIIDSEVIQQLVKSTNERAATHMTSILPRKTVNGIKWVDVTEKDIYLFLAFCMVMGVVKLPKITDYWSHEPVFGAPPIASLYLLGRS